MADTRREKLADARLYLCTDGRRRQGDLEDFLDAVLTGGPHGGVDIVQLREKGLEAREEIALAERFQDVCRRHGALFSINDRADLAHVVRPDILHVGQGDLPPAVVRDILGPDVLIGQSSHSGTELLASATDLDLAYFCVGPVWETPTKAGRPGVGLDLLRQAAGTAPFPGGRPWFVTGGVGPDSLDEVLATGARRVVVVRALTEAADPAAVAGRLAARLREA